MKTLLKSKIILLLGIVALWGCEEDVTPLQHTAPQVTFPVQETSLTGENREEKVKRLQWILQQMIREAVKENNQELCRALKESMVKELDYQFRSREEREEERDRRLEQRSEEYYQKMDELLRKKTRGQLRKQQKEERRPKVEKESTEIADKENTGREIKAEKKKRHFIF